MNKVGLHFPNNRFLNGLGHHSLFLPIMREEGTISKIPAFVFRGVWSHFKSFYLKSGKDVFVSSELAMIAALRAGQDFDRLLSETLNGIDYKLVICVRPHVELIQSAYNQLIKKSHFVGSVSDLYAQYGNDILSYCAVISRLSSSFSKERIILLDASQSASEHNTIVEQFFACTDYKIEADLTSIEGRANVSLRPNKLKKRWFETMTGERKFKPILDNKEALVPHNTDSLSIPSDDFFVLQDEQRQEIRERYQPEWEKLWFLYDRFAV
ncbi:hypothetical protein [Kordiimonas laminariae]|uniref:hypothetical protein n=1 Tax=Kordiimonas laminariae TaxID=2917717 RepID=UPI001FF18F8E|nr:hypothetical protein [Kordiimonas laminariae]MCK0069268.1 hypothetical protein [Kordiimonas laminariae]